LKGKQKRGAWGYRLEKEEGDDGLHEGIFRRLSTFCAKLGLGDLPCQRGKKQKSREKEGFEGQETSSKTQRDKNSRGPIAKTR